MTTSEQMQRLAEALRQIAELARVCASTDDLSTKLLRAAMDDIALLAARRAKEAEAP